jgi:phage baseplate assembly protein W
MAQLLCSRLGERAMRLDYGTTVAEAIFENALDSPEEAIRKAVRKWLPHLVVDKVSVLKDTDAYQVTVTYTTPDRELLTSTVGLAVPGEGVR